MLESVDLQVGAGAEAVAGKKASVHDTGTLTDNPTLELLAVG